MAFSDILGYNESMVQGVLVKGALVSADKECQRPMMKVAVCSNDLAALEQVRMMTGRIWGEGACDGYLELRNLFLAIEGGERYAAVLLDVQWEGEPRGIDAAGDLFFTAPETRIIYMTRYPERYVQQIFLTPANVSGFLIRPVEEGLLEKNLQKVLEAERRKDPNSLLVRHKSTTRSIRFEEILYLESAGHMVTIHTRTGSHRCYDRLEHLYERLPEYFIQCHKSYVVNMNEIHRMEKGQVWMDDEMKIPISKARYGATKARYHGYMERLLMPPQAGQTHA